MVPVSGVEALIEASIDDAELTRWLFRFSLFSLAGARAIKLDSPRPNNHPQESLSPSAALFGLFKPLFDPAFIQSEPVRASRAPRVGSILPVVALLARGDVNGAVEAA